MALNAFCSLHGEKCGGKSVSETKEETVEHLYKSQKPIYDRYCRCYQTYAPVLPAETIGDIFDLALQSEDKDANVFATTLEQTCLKAYEQATGDELERLTK